MLIALIISVWLLIQTTPVQNFIVRKVTSKLSKELNTTVRIGHVDLDLFNTMLLEQTLIMDQQKDTLLYAGMVKVSVTDWFFFKENIELKYVGLKDAMFHLQRTDSTWNYQFLLNYFSAPPSAKKKNSINLKLKTVDFENVGFIQRDGWRGEDMIAVVQSLDLNINEFDIEKQVVHIDDITLSKPSFAISNYTGTRKTKPVVQEEVEYVNDPEHLRWNPDNWQFSINRLQISQGAFKSDILTEREAYETFDGAHILFTDINASFTNVRLQQDSLTAKVLFSTKERSGFEVKSLEADMRMHPEAMEFANLDLQTNRSRLQNYFALRYPSFNDMSDFVSKVRMEANFEETILNSDDIAFFAPQVKEWKKRIVVSGQVKGSVENLNGRNLVIEAGKDTYLNGNISIAGLPDINKTYIDFEANAFNTTYNDAIAFVPVLRKFKQPRLDLLQFFRFKGNFTGFIQDFVTYGTVQTRLGTLVTDLNMKLPERGIASYSGTISTQGFEIGKFVESPQMGRISFKGNINGRGMNAATLNARLEGDVEQFQFNGYDYRDITIRGNVAKRLFNGEVVSADPNFDLILNGLIDFGKDIPDFDFNAVVQNMDLRKLNLFGEDLVFNGKFAFNFSGSNIDNFLGTARVYDASVFRSGRRISFDSLSIESKVLDNNKIITALSNEFDAALVGEFSIRDLPAAFQTFLNKYYPSYINPSPTGVRNENFSFVITTKRVDEYVSLINRNLSGFNFSTLTGRINSKENLLDLNVEIPQFNYQQIGFYNLALKAIGTYDSLSVESNIANILINDSLNFPGTTIRINSANDISDVNINTSANQTLNSANVQAQIQTLPRGGKITFRESGFDVNGKKWVIEKDGELILTEDLVSADGIKLYNADQEILVTTVPSDIGNTNDIRVELTKVNIGDFTPYVVKSNRIEGLLSGTINILDPFGKFMIEVNTDAEQFRLDNDSIGRVQLNANYSQRNGLINFGASSDNKNYDFDVTGLYKLKDSTGDDLIDIRAALRDTRIDLLQQYLSGVFSNITGLATGDLRITGAAADLDYLGTVQLKEGGMRVNFTNVYYKIPTATFRFTAEEIDFGSFQITDTLGNTGTVSKGHLYHNGFSDLAFDFAMSTNKLLVLSTNNQGTDPFYGNVIARANMNFSGPLNNMQMDIRAAPADSSSLYINTKSSRESGQADFVIWKVYGREMESTFSGGETNLTVTLDVTANNYANMYVILDELTGDIIQANGRGNLQIRAGSDGEFTIAGRYDIDRGNYNFNFESLLKKPFKLRENAGNYIQWTGDPNNAIIKIDAEYEAENVRFSDLGIESIQTLTGEVNNNIRNYRGKILVIASLTEELMSPTIRFSIDLPPGNQLKNDLNAMYILRKIQEDENELNKQVAFLIVFNSFGPLSTSPNQGNVGGAAFEGLVVNSISGILSNTLSRQFSDIFQRLFNDKSIRVNFNAQLYNGTNFINSINRNVVALPDRTNLNLSIGKNFFNERLTFTFGSAIDFGLSAAQANATRNLPFLPDITAEWKIRPDGKVVLTFFYRDTYNSILAGARQNRSGASISFRREFDEFGELIGKERKRRRPNARTVSDSSIR